MFASDNIQGGHSVGGANTKHHQYIPGLMSSRQECTSTNITIERSPFKPYNVEPLHVQEDIHLRGFQTMPSSSGFIPHTFVATIVCRMQSSIELLKPPATSVPRHTCNARAVQYRKRRKSEWVLTASVKAPNANKNMFPQVSAIDVEIPNMMAVRYCTVLYLESKPIYHTKGRLEAGAERAIYDA